MAPFYPKFRPGSLLTRALPLLAAALLLVGCLQEKNLGEVPQGSADGSANAADSFEAGWCQTTGGGGNDGDGTPPGDVSQFSASGGDGEVALSWVNPADTDFVGVVIVRSTVGFPDNTEGGTGIYSGAGAGHTDAGLDNDTLYYYTAFTCDGVPNYSTGANAAATPSAGVAGGGDGGGDTAAPPKVGSFVATKGDGEVTLSWLNPTDEDFAGVAIRRATDGFPATVTDGAEVYTGAGVSHNDAGLANGTLYFYSAFSYDGAGSYSGPAYAAATPAPAPLSVVGMFTDSNLEACAVDAGGTTAITTMTCQFYDISDLSGIENLTNLTSLSLQDNNISDISPLASLTGLTELNISLNNISDFSALASLSNLIWLEINSNNINNISLPASLASLTSLTYLNASQNNISDISALAVLDNLTELWIGNNNISNIAPLVSLGNLSVLDLDTNNIVDISPLASMINLAVLYLQGNNISDISALATLTNLTGLHLNVDDIGDLSPISSLVSLENMRVARDSGSFNNTDLSVLTPFLSPLTNFDQLWIQAGAVTDFTPLVSLTNLQYFGYIDTWGGLGTNGLASMAAILVSLPNLTSLDIFNNSLTDVTPLSSLSNLESLGLRGNDITTGVTALIALTNLTYLDLSGSNSIPCADLDALEAALGSGVVARPDSCAQ